MTARSTLSRVVILLLASLLTACGGSGTKPGREHPASPLPAAVIVDQIIEGPILGVKLNKPWGLAATDDGHLFVTDNGNHRLIQFDQTLTPARDIGGFGSAEGFFNRPTYIAIDQQLNILVTDEGNRRLCRFNSRLSYVESISFYDDQDPLKFGYPSGIATTTYGEIWVGDRDNDRIAVFSNVGNFDRFVGDFGYSGGQVISPEAIRIAPADEFLVCDGGNGRLVFYDEYGNFEREMIDNYLEYPISAAPSGNRWWVVDGSTGRIILVSDRGEVLFEIIGQPMGTSRPLVHPSDIAVLPGNRLAIADTGNNRILICKIVRDQE